MDAELLELRAYLLLPKERRQALPCHQRFEGFLQAAQRLFSLRMAAEARFTKHRWLAKREEDALPLTWAEVDAILSPTARRPRAGLETRLAREMPPILSRLFEDVRKQLRRSRKPVGVSQVRQLDASCLRWLVRQPGRSVAEKAGPRQKVMGVVREDEYDTPENRVLKDFLLRVRTLTDCWLDDCRTAGLWEDPSAKAVAHLNSLCTRGLALDALGNVGALVELPAPNFVLQQDNRYARLWRAYRQVIRWTRTLEGLWSKRERLERDLDGFARLAKQLSRNRHLSELWVRPSDCREESCFEVPLVIAEEAVAEPCLPPATGLRVIDLMGDRLSDILLAPDGRHPNAQPRLIDFDRPYVDFPPTEEPQHRARAIRMCKIWQKRGDTPATRDRLWLYFAQLHARLGGDQWILLIPDDWDAEWQEAVLNAAAQTLPRAGIRLLWRSIACAVGGGDPQKCGTIVCRRGDGRHTKTNLRYSANDGKPIRRSYLLHNADYTIPRIDTHKPLGSLFAPCWSAEPNDTAQAAARGARIVHDDLSHGRIPYYDELEGLYLLIQTPSEELRFLELIPPKAEWPAGKDFSGPSNRDTAIPKGSNELKLWVQITAKEGGGISDRLKSYVAHFDNTFSRNEVLQLQASANPGQGTVKLHFTILSSGQTGVLRLERLSLLMRHNVCPNVAARFRNFFATVAFIEQNIERSFPPTASRVYASDAQWLGVGSQQRQSASAWVPAFIRGEENTPDAAITYNPADRYPSAVPLPDGVSPLERLSRDNVFGNVPGHRLPTALSEAEADRFFRLLANKLHKRYAGSEEWRGYIRIIAWTYQGDNPVFDEAKRQCLERLQTATQGRGAGIAPQVFTLCANLLTDEESWRRCLNCIYTCLKNRASFTNVDEYLRLFYNLMQFHPDFVEKTKLYENTDALHFMTDRLCDLYANSARLWPVPKRRSTLQGYLLKCLLYLLRCRRYDGKTFLGEQDDANRKLRGKLIKTLEAPTAIGKQKELRDTVINYILGKGTIDGLPTN